MMCCLLLTMLGMSLIMIPMGMGLPFNAMNVLTNFQKSMFGESSDVVKKSEDTMKQLQDMQNQMGSMWGAKK